MNGQFGGIAVNGNHDGQDFLPAEPLALRDLALKVNDRVQHFLSQTPKSEQLRRVQEQTRISLEVMKESFRKYTQVFWLRYECLYANGEKSLSEISLSYNGGKDCLVLLVLYIAALASHPSFQTSSADAKLPPIQTVYIVSQHPFEEVEEFVQSTSKTYCLSLTRYAKSMKSAFQDYLHEFPEVKAIFVGTRRTDPHGANLTHFDPTDHGWPSFMRVHPVIDWHYADIWAVSFFCTST
jgi:FAD synthetase